VQAVGGGVATITVTTQNGGFTDSCIVTAIRPVESVSLSQPTATLTVGSSNLILTATVLPADASNKTVTWSSDALGVATVSNSGMVVPVGGGTAIITATTQEGNFTASCTVTVIQPVQSVSLNKNALNLFLDDMEQLVPIFTPSDATNQNVTWSSTDNAVATVSPNGTVTATGAGAAAIMVTTQDGNKIASCAVIVTTPTVFVQGVSLDESELTLFIGTRGVLTATVTPADADHKTVTVRIRSTAPLVILPALLIRR
jgi:uncharacterized protein YjdB